MSFIFRFSVLSLILMISLPALRAHAARSHFDPAEYLGNSGFRTQRDSTITYSADSLHMEIQTRRSLLMGSGKLGFQNMHLSSPNIMMDWRSNLVEAWISDEQMAYDRASADSLRHEQKLEVPVEVDSLTMPVDSTLAGGSTVQFNQGFRDIVQTNSVVNGNKPLHRRDTGLDNWPAFDDGTQELVGQRMTMNIRTRQGRVVDGRTSDDEGLYYGLRIKRVHPSELHASDAGFTTCDETHPHYCFHAKKLKMLVKDRILARDVWLYFGNVPTLYTPVAMVSLKRGRASGLIVPGYGKTDIQGRKLSHLGWYWAASDYWDTKVTVDFAENGPDWLFYNYTRWKTDANNSGTVSYSYGITRTSNNTGWDLRWRHNQRLNPWTTLAANVSLASSRSYYQDNSDNLAGQLTRQLTSSATLNGSFPQQGIRWTLSANATQDLETDYVNGTLPSARITLPTYNPFAIEDDKQHGALRSWLAGTVISYNVSAKDNFSGDGWNMSELEHDRGVQHVSTLSIPGRISYLSLTPSISGRSDWLFETQHLVQRETGELDTLEEGGLAIRNTFNVGLASSTDLYGTFYTRRGPLLALRHVVSPGVKLTWAPDFSKDFWGYYDSADYVDSSGVTQHVILDRFSGSLYGSTPNRDALSLAMSLDQVFQGKFRSRAKEDTLTGTRSSEPLRMDLLGLNSRSSYNFRAEEFRLADLSTSWRIDPLRLLTSRLGVLQTLSLSLSTVNSFYKVDDEGRRINLYRWQEGPGREVYWPRLTRTNITLSTAFNGKAKSGSYGSVVEDTDNWEDGRFRPDFLTGNSDIPWNISLSMSWTKSTANPLQISRQHYANATGSLSLSAGWRLSSGMQYDFINDTFNASSLRIYRDMHCWEGSFVWNPRSSNPSFHLLIRIKADALQDLKWDKKRGSSASYLP